MDRLVVRSFWSTSGQCCKPHESERDSQRLVVTLEWFWACWAETQPNKRIWDSARDNSAWAGSGISTYAGRERRPRQCLHKYSTRSSGGANWNRSVHWGDNCVAARFKWKCHGVGVPFSGHG
jgi:hypothetical protein